MFWEFEYFENSTSGAKTFIHQEFLKEMTEIWHLRPLQIAVESKILLEAMLIETFKKKL